MSDRYIYKIETEEYQEPIEEFCNLSTVAACSFYYKYHDNLNLLLRLCRDNAHRMNAEDREYVDWAEIAEWEELYNLVKKYNLALIDMFSTQECNYLVWIDYPTIIKEWRGINRKIKELAQALLKAEMDVIRSSFMGEVFSITITDTLYGEDLETGQERWSNDIAYGYKQLQQLEKEAESICDRLNAEHDCRLEYVSDQIEAAKDRTYYVDGKQFKVRTITEYELCSHRSLDADDLGKHYIIVCGTLQFI